MKHECDWLGVCKAKSPPCPGCVSCLRPDQDRARQVPDAMPAVLRSIGGLGEAIAWTTGGFVDGDWLAPRRTEAGRDIGLSEEEINGTPLSPDELLIGARNYF